MRRLTILLYVSVVLFGLFGFRYISVQPLSAAPFSMNWGENRSSDELPTEQTGTRNQGAWNSASSDAPTDGPDLMVESIRLNPPPPYPPNAVVNITPIIKNIGNQDAAQVRIYLYVQPLDNPPDAETEITSKVFFDLPLAAGGTFDGWTRTDQPVTEAEPLICAWVDPQDNVAEADEENNLFCINGQQGTGTPTRTPTPEPDTPTATPEPTTPVPETPTPETPDPYEPDDPCADASTFIPNEAAQRRNFASTDGTDDEDWIKFEVTKGMVYTIEVKPDSDSGTTVAPIVNLGNNDANCSRTLAATSKLVFEATDDKTVYAVISKPSEGEEQTNTSYLLTIAQSSGNGCYTLSLGYTGNGNTPTVLPSNSSTCVNGQYRSGEVVSLIASPSKGWQVSGWSGTDNDGTIVPTNRLTMPDADHSVRVTYAIGSVMVPFLPSFPTSTYTPTFTPTSTPTPTATPTPTPTFTPVLEWQPVGPGPLVVSSLDMNDDMLFATDRNAFDTGGGAYRRPISGCLLGPGFERSPAIERGLLEIEVDGLMGLAASDSGLYYSNDGGTTWIESEHQAPVYSVVIHDSEGYAGSGNSVYKSSDGGATWELLTDVGKEVNVIRNYQESLWLGSDGLGVQELPLGPGSLSPQNDGLDSQTSREIWDIFVSDSDIIYIATYDGVFQREAAGGTWEQVGTALRGVRVRSLEVVNDQLYAGTVGSENTPGRGIHRISLANPGDWTQVIGNHLTSANWWVRDLYYDAVHCGGLIAGTDNGVWVLR
ncbi:MAG: CARDB domain-containing protein [Chloroflexota bacterium]